MQARSTVAVVRLVTSAREVGGEGFEDTVPFSGLAKTVFILSLQKMNVIAGQVDVRSSRFLFWAGISKSSQGGCHVC